MRASLILMTVLAAGLFIPVRAQADVLPPYPAHTLNRCIKLGNVTQFPEIEIVSVVTGPMEPAPVIKTVSENQCLNAGYKHNNLDLYWRTKGDAQPVADNQLLIASLEVYGGYIPDDNPLKSEEIEYSLARNVTGALTIYKSQQISRYNNGDPQKVETFDPPSDVEKTTVAPGIFSAWKAFWHTISCFFARIFSHGCTA